MRYNINARLIYDATDGTLTLPGSDEPDSQLSITASALLYFFLRHTGVVSRDEVLKKVWDDNGLTSSNSNLNQYLSMLRKTFRHYDIDNIIVTVSRGMLQLNQDLNIELLDAGPALADVAATYRYISRFNPYAARRVAEGLLIAGDTLFRRGIGRTDLWGGDYPTIERSIRQRLYTLDEEATVVTGHGPDTRLGDEMRENPFVRA